MIEELRDRFSDLWEERRLLVILVALILVVVICCPCGLVGRNFISGKGAPAPVAIATPAEEEAAEMTETPEEEEAAEVAETPEEEETPGLPTATEKPPFPKISPTATHVLRKKTPTLAPATPIAEKVVSPTPTKTPTEEIAIAVETPTEEEAPLPVETPAEEQAPITGATAEEETPITERAVPSESLVPPMTAPVPETATPRSPAEAETETPPAAATPGAVPALETLGNRLRVHFIDVGQGDAILLQSPGATMLIDGGDRSSGVVDYLKWAGVARLDSVVSTLPSPEYLGGLSEVLRSFPVGQVLVNGGQSADPTFDEFQAAVQSAGIPLYQGQRGEVIAQGDLNLNVLHPAGISGQLKEDALVLRLVYGNVSFLFTSAAGREAAASIMAYTQDLAATVLKVSDHASREALGADFLAAVRPEVAIYTAAAGNAYGLPHQETLDALAGLGAQIYGTDTGGTIVITTDGQTYSVQQLGQAQAPPPTRPPGGETPVTTPRSTPGQEARVLITRIHNSATLEYVLLINEGGAAQDLSGWRIQADHAWQDFYFPQGTVIQPGMTIRVNSGPEAIDQPPADLLWTRDLVWNDGGDTARLYNATNNLSTQYTYVP